MPEVAVISTAYAPAPELRRACELSVLGQTVPLQHVYIDAAESGGACSENVYNAVQKLDPATVVLWVDGDDWLAHDRVVERVLQEYQRGAWVTWGQFVYADGSPGWANTGPAVSWLVARQKPWFATHLKTFRAGLFQKIRGCDLRQSTHGWVTRAVDQAVMFPMLEMAAERGRFIPEVLYVYSGRNTTAPEADEIAEARRIRAMQPYMRLEKKPW